METDKRSFYIWIAVFLANIGMVLAIILFSIYEHNSLFESWNLVPLGISLFVTIVPILISRSKSRLKNFFGYGIPILLLLPLSYFIYDYYTCTGKFCEISPLFFGWSFCLSAIIFALFYTIGIYARKRTVEFVFTLIRIEVILLAGSVLYFGANIINRLY